MSIIPQSDKFLANVLEATLRGVIAWEATADPETLTGQLEGDYSLRLEKVPDFDELPGEKDYILSLKKGRQTVLSVDRRDFSPEDINNYFGNRFEYAHSIFAEIWRYASAKAYKISDSLDEANQILNKMISG